MTGGWGVDGRYRSPAWSGGEPFFMVFGTWPLSMYTRSGRTRCRAAAPARSEFFRLQVSPELMTFLAGADNLGHDPNGSTCVVITYPQDLQAEALDLTIFRGLQMGGSGVVVRIIQPVRHVLNRG